MEQTVVGCSVLVFGWATKHWSGSEALANCTATTYSFVGRVGCGVVQPIMWSLPNRVEVEVDFGL
jgi:hypothetical protein